MRQGSPLPVRGGELGSKGVSFFSSLPPEAGLHRWRRGPVREAEQRVM